MNRKWTQHVGAFLSAVLLLAVILWCAPASTSPQKTLLIKGDQERTSGFYPNLTQGEQPEIDYISSIQQEDQITIFGSSEFSGSFYCPFNFIPEKIGKPALGLGHAHHQHLSILGELAAAESYLKDSKITILISPTWFNTSGTNSSAFVEFMRPNFLKEIVSNSSLSDEYKVALGKAVHKNYSEFSDVSHEMHVLRETYLQKNGWVGQKWISQLRSWIKDKFSFRYYTPIVEYDIRLTNQTKVPKEINWQPEMDSLQTSFLNAINTNELFVNDTYYEKYLIQKNGSVKTGKFKPVDVNSNQEFQDFKAVVKLLHEKQADATFVILPINPFFYEGMEDANALIENIKAELESKKVPYLNLFTKNKDSYEPGILKDVMHLGDYGWMKVNKYLIDHYYE